MWLYSVRVWGRNCFRCWRQDLASLAPQLTADGRLNWSVRPERARVAGAGKDGEGTQGERCWLQGVRGLAACPACSVPLEAVQSRWFRAALQER